MTYIEVKGTNHTNKGAELMLRRIVDEVSSWSSRPSVVVSPRMGPYPWRSRMGLFQKISPARMLRPGWPDPAILVPDSVRRLYGLVGDREISAVFDASGFAYGAQWGPRSTANLAKSSRQWKSSGKKVFLLPQAFGPFDTPSMKEAFREVVARVEILYARDEISLEHVRQLGVDRNKVRLAPDITVEVEGRLPDRVEVDPQSVAVVPNRKILEKGIAEWEDYRGLLLSCIRLLREFDLRPFILVHDTGGDRGLAQDIVREEGGSLEVVERGDPVELKGIIGACRFLVGSRYHALVAALSQGVPVVAVGWSHKYEALLADYRCPENIIEFGVSSRELREKFASLVSGPERRRSLERIEEVNTRHRAASRRMWSEIRMALDP